MSSSKKYCLVIPYAEDNKYSIHVLIAAIEANKIDIDIYLTRMGDFNKVVNFLLTSYDKVIVGISLMTTQLPEMLPFLESLKELKDSLNGRLLLVGGGPHVSGDPLGSLKRLGFDFVFIGEAEKSFTEFLSKLLEGLDFKDVKGIAYIEDDKVLIKYDDHVVNLNEFPPISLKYGLFNPIEVSRGCPYACKYCQVSYIFGRLMRHRSLDIVLRYCRELIKRGINDLRFISPNILAYGGSGTKVNFNALAEFVEGIKKLKDLGGRPYLGSFPSEMRPDFIEPDTIKLIKDVVSNRKVSIGIQSGSDRVLKELNRGHTVEDALNAINLLRSYGFVVDADLIVGLPNEDLADSLKTLELIQKLIDLGGVRIHLHHYIPLPGTPLAKYGLRPIPEVVRSKLMRLLGKGVVFGNWLRQEVLAYKIQELRMGGVILN
ncbi:MAG: TIGR04013 family B12-binding domain/radical SAM domain-containing protein [Sulfolobales archaeon]